MTRPDEPRGHAPAPPARSSARPSPRPALAALLVLALAGPAAAAATPRLAIAPVKGDVRGKIGAQLRSALCTTNRCVGGAVQGNRLRPDRARKLRVQAALFATVRQGRGRREVSLALVTPARRPLGLWRLPVGRDRLIPWDRLERVVEEIDAALPGQQRAPAPPPLPAPEPPPPVAARSAFSSARAPGGEYSEPAPALRALPQAGEEPGDPEPFAAGALAQEPTITEVVVSRSTSGLPSAPRWRPDPAPRDAEPGALPPTIAGDAGLEAARRGLAFPSIGTKPRGYVVNLAVPRLRLETHPLRDLGELAASVGVFAEGAYLPVSALAPSAQGFQVAYLHLRAGALSRLQLWGGLVLRPALSWELERVWLRARGGAAITGLPDVALSGPSLGVDLALPLWSSRFTLLGSARAMWWLQAGAPHYFPGARALGLDLEGGAGLRLFRSLSIRALACYDVTQWSLAPASTGPYSVRTARAVSVGVRTWIRLEL